MTELPPDLAPSKRAAAEALLAECTPGGGRRHSFDREVEVNRCWKCGKPGPLVWHHKVHGDDSTLVRVHASCHRKLHRKAPVPKDRASRLPGS